MTSRARIPFLLSLLLPGLGQLSIGRRERGWSLVGGTLGLLVVLIWLHEPAAWLTLLPFWLAAAYDAAVLADGRPPATARLVCLAALPLYLAAWQASAFAPQKLVTQWDRAKPMFGALLHPTFVERTRESAMGTVEVLTPCAEGGPGAAGTSAAGTSAAGTSATGTGVAAAGQGTPATQAQEGAPGARSVKVTPACADLGAEVTVTASGFMPDSPAELDWLSPSDDVTALGPGRTDAQGRLETVITIPVESIPSIYRDRVQRQKLRVTVVGKATGFRLNDDFAAILDKMGVTIALSLMATLFGALLALPLSLLGAKNLMSGNPVTLAIYGLVRMLMNVVRSIEPIILAVIFVVWVAQGPFAGVLALSVHAMAALGKLYSETIEDIDPGPVEAIRATGAGWLQTVVFAVLPQVVSPFLAYTVYRWEINVRMSTILGLVGAGGVGYLLNQWIFQKNWPPAMTAVLVIAVVVMALDAASASVRARLLAGKPLVRPSLRPLLYAALVAVVVWAAWLAEIRPAQLVRGAPKILPVVNSLFRPELTTRDAITRTWSTPLVVPCATGGTADEGGREVDAGDAELSLGATCADPGQRLNLAGKGLPPNLPGLLRWIFPKGGQFSIAQIRSDAQGRVDAVAEVRPLLAEVAAREGGPVRLQLELREPVGGVTASTPLRQTTDQLILTILMALLATTLGGILALPLGMLGARNIVPPTPAGNFVYTVTRTLMNLVRAVEPLIWGALFAAWVGYGTSFAGVMALVVVTTVSLGKLFSEAVENIDPGPLEAIAATGANRLQTILYGVVPQILPPFLAYGIYHWDINVRLSTVIGLVGGGGIGRLLGDWMNTTQWSKAAVAILGIVIVVTAMDTLSARVREKLV